MTGRRNPNQRERGQGEPLKVSKIATMKPGRHSDGRYGLMLDVKPSGGRSWLQRLTVDGKRRTVGLGPWPIVGLAEARAMAFENVKQRHHGINPFAKRERTETIPTFAEAVEAFIALQRPGWKAGSRNEANWRSSLAHAAPLNDRPIDAIATHDVIAVLLPIWHAKHTTAKALRQRIAKIMDWARAAGHRADNPADSRIDAALPNGTARKVEHRAALDWQDAPEAYRTIGTVQGSQRGAALALQFLILTGTRDREARLARWCEIDESTATWTVPADRVKTGRAFRVALSGAALAVLAEARKLGCRGGTVFSGARRGAVTDSGLRDLQRKLGIGATVHGWRSTLRGWCSAHSVRRDVAEWLLNHQYMSDTEAAYDRGDRLAERRPVMQAWAKHVTG